MTLSKHGDRHEDKLSVKFTDYAINKYQANFDNVKGKSAGIKLEDCGIKEIVINVHYLADQIIEFIGKNKFKSKIYISHEKEKILGTGGGLIYASNNIKNFFQLNESFLTVNPDTLWNSNYTDEFKILEESCVLLFLSDLKDLHKSIDRTHCKSGSGYTGRLGHAYARPSRTAETKCAFGVQRKTIF